MTKNNYKQFGIYTKEYDCTVIRIVVFNNKEFIAGLEYQANLPVISNSIISDIISNLRTCLDDFFIEYWDLDSDFMNDYAYLGQINDKNLQKDMEKNVRLQLRSIGELV